MELHHLTEYLPSKLLVYFLTSPKRPHAVPQLVQTALPGGKHARILSGSPEVWDSGHKYAGARAEYLTPRRRPRGGTDGSNPAPSSNKSAANLFFLGKATTRRSSFDCSPEGPAVRILFAPAASPSLAGDAAFVGRDAARSGTLRLPDSCRALDAVVVTTAGLYGDKAY